MCGILGAIGSKVDEVQFTSILARMEHRGPDGFGVWKKEEDGIIFGHRRLSIIDSSDGGKQPFEKGKYVLNFNGEIYNYLELRKNLQNVLQENIHNNPSYSSITRTNTTDRFYSYKKDLK